MDKVFRVYGNDVPGWLLLAEAGGEEGRMPFGGMLFTSSNLF